ncbi:hypothetical protein N7528_002462 [Penicillium herquei]|nr:hypothetical protein N7528_002462 [Penicillium herquei]
MDNSNDSDHSDDSDDSYYDMYYIRDFDDPLKFDEPIKPSHLELHIFSIVKQIPQLNPKPCIAALVTELNGLFPLGSKRDRNIIGKEAWEFVRSVEKIIFSIVPQIPFLHDGLKQMVAFFEELSLTWWGGRWMNLGDEEVRHGMPDENEDHYFMRTLSFLVWDILRAPPFRGFKVSDEDFSDVKSLKWERASLSTHTFFSMLRAKNLVVSPDLAAEVLHGAIELHPKLPMSMRHRVAIIREWLLNAGMDIYECTQDDLDVLPERRLFNVPESLGLTRWEYVKQKLEEMIPDVPSGTKDLIEFDCLTHMKSIECFYE